ncbi:hypothetical protein, conserved [Trypanosoma brucei gambiense DAL972]|uniref:Pentapeptide repeat-containing protein n=1 Tax=Trypanosoma brucei gambiense (strain MHOM/CI/86/DAL972) TaxID=679716 RepID=D0A3J4_TRYB9|nr:hypothetical protein, conserved [Trypanosoma brucei gambiense DAL972]CBH15838.1 hypothetical protein, conserved [Trypanosoma brucei gambiense DAL972]|eukprot:XP_011778102.1 hypothetical protein, conserved [Trypanosoma brucei gambiense DAL972]
MERCLSLGVISRLLDALNLRRKVALLSLPFETSMIRVGKNLDSHRVSSSASSSPAVPYAKLLSFPLEAEMEVQPLVRGAVLEALGESAGGQRAADGGCRRVESVRSKEIEIGSILEGRCFSSLDFACTNLSASFNRCALVSASLGGAFVSHSTFNLTDIKRSSFIGAQFHSCTFLATDAVGVDARCGRFSHCTFCRASMSGWDVRGATFYRCTFTMCDMSGWTYDSQTTVVEPVGWECCRRLNWVPFGEGAVGDCRVVREQGGERGLSLRPREHPPWVK